ncbi:MAG: hypothetical protein F4047_07385, partial [Caldilineaceae bacterium SB0670_bin_27]|nr:hypothetical protein [Caldilineaceae bacterium SB0670_bin_27]
MDNRSYQAMRTESVPLNGKRTTGRRHAAYESFTGSTRRLLINAGVFFWAFLAIASLAACDTDNEEALDTSAPAPLSIPELLEPTFDAAGVAHYDLKIGESRHDYRQTALTDTYSYNGMSVLGPTLRLRT